MNRVFPILGTEAVKLQGRVVEQKRCFSDLTKGSPSHLQVIGSRFSGKTTLLKHLECASDLTNHYSCVVYWDLGHNTPQTDGQFFSQLSEKISTAIRSINHELADLLNDAECSFQDLKEVIDEFSSENINVLMLWDGMDKPLASGTLTRNLWDQLRDIASYPGIRLVTASRKSMQELVRNEESQTSDFWNIFDQVPVKLSPFSPDDIALICDKHSIKLAPGAAKEILNWTGNYPPLVLELFNFVLDAECTDLSNVNANIYAEQTYSGLESILNKLWDDCSQEAKDAFHQLVDAGEFAENQISPPIYNELSSLGVAFKSDRKTRPCCRLIEKISQNDKTAQSALERVFLKEQSFEENISKVLLLRLNQLPLKHPKIHKVIETCLSDIPEDLETCLSQIRQLTNKFFELIWELEFGGRTLPEGLTDIWRRDNQRFDESLLNQQVPRNNQSKELNLLRLLVGAANNGVKHSDVVDQQVYLKMNVLYNYGNYGQHNDGESRIGSALTAVTASIELLAFFSAGE